jgi:hypothetical protein
MFTNMTLLSKFGKNIFYKSETKSKCMVLCKFDKRQLLKIPTLFYSNNCKYRLVRYDVTHWQDYITATARRKKAVSNHMWRHKIQTSSKLKCLQFSDTLGTHTLNSHNFKKGTIISGDIHNSMFNRHIEAAVLTTIIIDTPS